MGKQKEEWKDYSGSIKQFHGWIRVSNLGRIFKKAGKTSKGGILKTTKNKQGYMRLHVSIDGKTYNKPVHRLVAETFCENLYNKPFVDHVNAIRDDNRASNLRWVTTSENNQNPIYVEKLKKRITEQFKTHNHLQEANKKKCLMEHKNGTILIFDSIQDVQNHFNTKANLNRKIKSGEYFTSKKSKLYGWRIRLL